MKMLGINYETADLITRLNLTDARDYMKSELKKYNDTMETENPYWMHPDDVVNNQILIKQIDNILNYYGGELYGERETGQPD
jgi:hypothetical protein